jgi:ABC-type antimicrobial peptide transport system permease subunit
MAKDIKILDQEITYYNFYGEQVMSSLNYDEIIVSIDSIRSNEGFDKNFSDYMKQNPHFSYNDALVSYTKELIVGNEVYNNRSYEYFLDNELIPEYKFDKIKVVGFVPGSVSYISDDLINKLDSPTKKRLGMYVNANDDDLKYVLKNYELVDYGIKLGENLAISFKDMSDVYSIINLYDFVNVYVAGISCVFIVFMVLLTYNFILTTITVSKKDIGILRALGARNKDIFKIFVSESMVVTLLSYFGGLMLFFVSLVIINNSFLVNPFNELNVIKIEFVSLLFSLVFSVIMSFLLSVLSINRVSLIKPIDAILDK